ncbi:unnamed protein product [Microthlaspi erraticum]|uniref:F-box domain-containing protein n=1 Tax=Microthlaspi erraticum TaxID=1685480 RepID=A0A6D2IFA6_9BRAS|nr:unnamed protein product [Microthlaspi erraticum]
MMMMSELPGEMVEEILCRVPATSLKRLRSTCKLWNRLFRDRIFTRKHFDKAPKQSMMLRLFDSPVHLMSINLRNLPRVEVTCRFSLLYQNQICRLFHCDGLLLCVLLCKARLVVWNPCTGQTRLISWNEEYTAVTLGSYQAKKSPNDNSYKILGYNGKGDRFGIYDINSNLWRILDVILDFEVVSIYRGVSLEGKTYWIARDQKDLVSFDYTTERFERLCLPRQYPSYEKLSLSVVREEKLAVLLQHHRAEKTEIWVTSKISEGKVVSWSKVLTVDLKPGVRHWECGSFLVDEKKKVLVFCDILERLSSVGEDNIVRNTYLGAGSGLQFLFNYVPSLTQIEKRKHQRQIEEKESIGDKRKRGE